MTDSESSHLQIAFGHPDFWSIAFGRYEQQFNAIAELVEIANQMLNAADQKAAEPVEKVVIELTRATVAGSNDVILLCGNGCGAGAMKIVRGMFESSWTAEYLRRNPSETDDYIDFGAILSWKRYRWLLKEDPSKAAGIATETIKAKEGQYDGVKSRFTDSKGRVRNQWTLKSIGKIAEAIGRYDEYELPYRIACSMHHNNFEGLSCQLDSSPPCDAWVKQALISAHTQHLRVLYTLNEACELDFSEKLDAAGKHFVKVWTE